MFSNSRIESHYAAAGLMDRLDSAFSEAGIPGGPVDWQQLAPFDQFHTRGLLAVKELAKLLAPQEGNRVLDLGSGLGGPARFLAAVYGCQVTGVDLTQLYVDVSNLLTERVGLSGLALFIQADATRLPFQDRDFDLAWTLHASMNIRDKAAFYSEIFRVLKPGGRFALYDVAHGDGREVVYPTPWAPVAELSFLATQEQTVNQLQAAGFHVVSIVDSTHEALLWMNELRNRTGTESEPARVDLRTVLGPAAGLMIKNMNHNFSEGRTCLVQALAQKEIGD